jgi:hypothetical protein
MTHVFISISIANRVEQLETSQLVSLEKYKSRTKEIKSSVSKELEEATLDAAGEAHPSLLLLLSISLTYPSLLQD